MSDILISIIIPYYNRSELLHYTLTSVEKAKEQSGYELEVIVIDDGSIDSPGKIIENKYSWVRLITQKNQGAPVARNKGLRESKGKYILYLDSDDLIEPDYFESKIKVLESSIEIAGAYGPFDFFSSKGDFQEMDIITRHADYPLNEEPEYMSHLERLLGGWYIPCNAILWRKEVIDLVSGQNENLKINQDVDLMFRILTKKNNIAGVSSGRALIRSHDGGRVGVLGKSNSKLQHIYNLRVFFKTKIEEEQFDTQEIRKSFARNCFGYWVSFREIYPELATQFLQLSNELYPKLNVQGHWYYEFLGKVSGKTNAVKIKDKLSAIIRL